MLLDRWMAGVAGGTGAQPTSIQGDQLRSFSFKTTTSDDHSTVEYIISVDASDSLPRRIVTIYTSRWRDVVSVRVVELDVDDVSVVPCPTIDAFELDHWDDVPSILPLE